MLIPNFSYANLQQAIRNSHDSRVLVGTEWFELLRFTGGLFYAFYPDGIPDSSLSNLPTMVSSHLTTDTNYKPLDDASRNPGDADHKLLPLLTDHLSEMWAACEGAKDDLNVLIYARHMMLPLFFGLRIFRCWMGWDDCGRWEELVQRWVNGSETMGKMGRLVERKVELVGMVKQALGILDDGGNGGEDGIGVDGEKKDASGEGKRFIRKRSELKSPIE